MSKEKAILITALALFTACGTALAYNLYDDIHRDSNSKKTEAPKANLSEENNSAEQDASAAYRLKTAKDFYNFVPIAELYDPLIDSNAGYYPLPTLKSSIAKYRKGNYTGCLQELYSYIKKHPGDAYAFYYMGLSYTRIGRNDLAQKCFQKTINCNASGRLLEMAVKGRDCLSGGPYCRESIYPERPIVQVTDPAQNDPALDAFVNAPYSGHGFSPELEQQYKQQQLNNMQKTINRKDKLDSSDIEEIKDIEKKNQR